jgi:hypothetical protein
MRERRFADAPARADPGLLLMGFRQGEAGLAKLGQDGGRDLGMLTGQSASRSRALLTTQPLKKHALTASFK